MTAEQTKRLTEIGAEIHEMFPEMFGSIKFNLKPGRDSVNINFVVEESKILEKPKN